MVSDFLTASGSWNLSLLEQHFSFDDQDIIAGIPLGSVSQRGDSRYWFFSKNGKYSVNTGYRVAGVGIILKMLTTLCGLVNRAKNSRSVPIFFRRINLAGGTFADAFEAVASRLSEADLERFACCV
ncbi:hypothetical protein GBA52_014829 [Prunus armeniaca]|nr:hypothetical protein GBA52_014829 [Prunus armeniaca]